MLHDQVNRSMTRNMQGAYKYYKEEQIGAAKNKRNQMEAMKVCPDGQSKAKATTIIDNTKKEARQARKHKQMAAFEKLIKKRRLSYDTTCH